MNLKQIKAALSKIDLKKQSLDPEADYNKSQFWLKNLDGFREMLDTLRPLPIFHFEKHALGDTLVMKSSQNLLSVRQSEYHNVEQLANSVQTGVRVLLDLLTQLIPPDDESSIVIKLPPPKDFEEAIEFQKDFFKAISQNVVNPEISGSVVLREWEPGSFWLTLFVGAPLAVRLIGQMTWSAAVVRKKKAEALILEQQAEALKLRNETLKEFKRGIADSIQLLIESEAKALAAANFNTTDNHDQIERLKMGIKTFAELIDKGAEIHPALQVPEDVKNLFPDFSKLPMIESKTKLLENAAPSDAPTEK